MVRLTNCKYYEITPFLTSDEDKSKELSCATAMVIGRQFEGKPIVYKYYYEAVLNIISQAEQDIALKYIIKCKDNSKHGIL